MENKLLKGFWNVPNILSLFRLLLVPVLVIAYFSAPGTNHIAALIIFIVASVTDILDGIIARTTNQITPIGTVLDPFADKLLKISTLLCFCIDGILPVWLSVLLIVIDLGMIITGLCLLKEKITIPSNFIGKLGTFVMSVGIVLCFLQQTFDRWGFYILCCGLGIIILSVIVYVALNAQKVFSKFSKNQKVKLQIDDSTDSTNESK